MEITFLGTSSGTPTRDRNVTSATLRLESGDVFMVDCGEATQHRLLTCDLRPRRISHILLTHLHGDHCFGLPGMISSIAIHGREEPLTIIGPPGIKRFLETALEVSETFVTYELNIQELEPEGGTFTAPGVTITARPITHRIATWGYVFLEDERRPRFLTEKARGLGIPPGPLYGQLQKGRPISFRGITITPDMVNGGPRPRRKVTILGDTEDASGIAEAAAGSDVLVHEATYHPNKAANARQWGHSTATEAAAFAQKIGAKHCILTHFSSRYTVPRADPSVDDLLTAAQQAVPEVAFHAADDHKRFTLLEAGGDLSASDARRDPDALDSDEADP